MDAGGKHATNHILSPEAVRERFAWAIREGNPQWLWPATSPVRWKDALFEIENAVRCILSGDPRGAFLKGDPDDIGIASFTSGMGPLLGFWADAGLLQAEAAILDILKLHYAHNRERMDRLAKVARGAVEALGRAGVEVTVLKGMHTAYSYFPAPGTRPVSDIDLWIRASDARIAQKTLIALDYRPDGSSFGEQSWRLSNTPTEPCSLSLVHSKGPWSIDLHTTMNRRYSAGAPMVQMDRALQAQRNETWALSSSGSVLTGPALILHLAFHAGLGLTSLSMLRLTELVFVIRQLEERDCLCWEAFLELAARTGNPACTYPALAILNLLAPGIAPETVMRRIRHETPATVRRVVAALSPATCQRVTRCSSKERFMWTASFSGWLREFIWWLFPNAAPAKLYGVYTMRFWRVVRGTVTR